MANLLNIPPNSGQLASSDGRPSVAWTNWFSQVYRICFAVSQSGTTANRPTKDLYVGRMYFDTTLTRPIWWTGTNWIKADGTVV